LLQDSDGIAFALLNRSPVVFGPGIRNRAERDGDGNDAVSKPVVGSPKAALTEAEAGRYIDMSSGWLKKSRTQRFRSVIDAPPFVRAGAKRVVYRREDLDAWQERHQVPPSTRMP
jgi:hypothetical protein